MVNSAAETRVILLAEDDGDIRELIRDSLRVEASSSNFAFEVVEAVDGSDAIEKVGTRQFHCVITDLRMPRASGEELIKAIQRQPLNANTPTLVVSGHAHEEFSEFCERFSHIKIFPKPFDPSQIAQAVIRELRLGRIDDRAPLHLLNPFLEAVHVLCDKDLHLQTQFGQPVVKKPGESLAGDYFCLLHLVSGVTRARLYLSFDRDFLEHARVCGFAKARTMNWASMTPDAVSRLIATDLFERAARALQDRMGGSPRLSSLAVFSAATRGADLADMLDASGVQLVARTDKGRVCAGAFNRAKTKRS